MQHRGPDVDGRILHSAVDAEYGDLLRKDLVDREGSVDDDSVRLLDRITDLRSKTNLQLPEIERTILKLSRRPKEGTLWARLLQRVAGWALGLSQVSF